MTKDDLLKIISVQVSSIIKIYLMFLFVLKVPNPLEWTVLERILFLISWEIFSIVSVYGYIQIKGQDND